MPTSEMDFDFYNAMCVLHFADVWYPLYGSWGQADVTKDFDAMICMGGEL